MSIEANKEIFTSINMYQYCIVVIISNKKLESKITITILVANLFNVKMHIVIA